MTVVALADSFVTTPTEVLSVINLDKDKVIKVNIILEQDKSATSLEEYAKGVIKGIYPTLSHSEIIKKFSPAQSYVDAVANFAVSNNLTVGKYYPSSSTLKLEGKVSDFNKAFGITLLNIVTYTSMYYSYDGYIYIPSNLQNIIKCIIGLDTSIELAPMLATHEVEDNVELEPSVDRAVALTPIQVSKAYNFPPSTGASQCIAILTFGGGYTQQNLTSTFAQIGRTPPRVVDFPVGATNRPDTSSGSLENMLDIYISSGVAPNAKIVMYFAPNTLQSFYNSIAAALNDTVNNPSAISISWGTQESSWPTSITSSIDGLFLKAIILGVTVTVATGDYGARAISSSPDYTIQYPAASPYVLACGGTTLMLNNDGSIANEYTWNTGSQGSAGGVSIRQPVLDWQQGLQTTTYPAGATAAITRRAVPDVAGNGDGLSGYRLYYGTLNRLTQVAGTSAVSPLYAGLVARLNSITKRRCGFLNPMFYENRNAFNDITEGQFPNTGNNACPPLPALNARQGYSVTVGWDACTGIGSPNGQQILNLLNEIRYYPNFLVGSRPTVGQTYPRVLISL